MWLKVTLNFGDSLFPMFFIGFRLFIQNRFLPVSIFISFLFSSYKNCDFCIRLVFKIDLLKKKDQKMIFLLTKPLFIKLNHKNALYCNKNSKLFILTESKKFFSLFCHLFSVKQTIQIHRPRAHNILHRHTQLQTNLQNNNNNKIYDIFCLKTKTLNKHTQKKEKKT